MTAQGQLGLPFPHAPDYAPEDFLRLPANEAALAWLGRPADWPDLRLIVWGEAGSGKTHLLHVWAASSGAAISAGPSLDWAACAASVLAGTSPLAIDDADAAPETALLHVMNAAAERRRPLVLTGRVAPPLWPARLPDLSSRLRAAPSVALHGPPDEWLAPLFARLLAERQLAVPKPVQEWLLRRLPRSPAALSEAAGRLDRALLASGGRMTRGLAASIVDSEA